MSIFIVSAGIFIISSKKEYRQDAHSLFRKGQLLRQAHRYEESNKVLKEGIKISSDPMFLNLIGKNMCDLGNLEEAENYYNRSACRLPMRLYPYYLKAKPYMNPGEKNKLKFLEAYREAIQIEVKVNSYAVKEMHRELYEYYQFLNMQKEK